MMTREQRRDIFEAIGLLAIVASLIFLALEVRQANLATRIAARDSASQGHIDYISNSIVPEILSVAQRKSFRDEELTGLESAQISQFHSMRWRHYERVFFLYQYNVISEGEWRGYENGILRALSGSSEYWEASRRLWERDRPLLSEQFVAYVDTLSRSAQ